MRLPDMGPAPAGNSILKKLRCAVGFGTLAVRVFLHHVRDSDPCEPLFTEFLRRDRHDALVRIRLFSLGMTHGPS